MAAHSQTAVWYNNAVYVGGGITEPVSSSHQVNIYHPDTNKWDSPIETPLEIFSMVVLMNKLLILAGLPMRKVFVLEGSQWKDYTELPSTRGFVAAVSYQTMMIVLGGYLDDNYFSTVEIFDDSCGQWSRCNDLPHPWGMINAVILDDTLYLSGGSTPEVNTAKPVYAASLRNISSLQFNWQRLPDIPWVSSSAVGVNNKYLQVGGETGNDTVCVLKTTKGSMVTSTSWESIGCLPTVLGRSAAVCCGNQVVMIGGGYDNGDSVVKNNAVYIGTFQ